MTASLRDLDDGELQSLERRAVDALQAKTFGAQWVGEVGWLLNVLIEMVRNEYQSR